MLTLDFINVGYGDAILAREGDFTLLVDCGDEEVGRSCPQGRRVMAGAYLNELGVDTLDLLVLTHLHLDHCGGLGRILDGGVRVRALLSNYAAPRALWGRRAKAPDGASEGAARLIRSLNIYLDALSRLGAQGAEIRAPKRSGEETQLTARLRAQLYPDPGALAERQEEILGRALDGRATCAELDELDGFINDTSLRLRLNYGAAGVELPGDACARCWEKSAPGPCDIFKLPHHGHRDAVTPRLIDLLKPACAVISVSDDREDDCPSPAVIRELIGAGAGVLTTDAVCLPGAPRAFREAVRLGLSERGDMLLPS